MARKYARLAVSVWDDPDFVSLKSVEQNVYFSIISTQDLSWCGVLPLLPRRIARTASDLTEKKVVAALNQLAAKNLIVVDEETDEILVRRFIHYDEVMKQPNIAKGMASALEKVHSQHISATIINELSREYVEFPDLKGWTGLSDAYPQLFAQICDRSLAKGSVNPSANPSLRSLPKGA